MRLSYEAPKGQPNLQNIPDVSLCNSDSVPRFLEQGNGTRIFDIRRHVPAASRAALPGAAISLPSQRLAPEGCRRVMRVKADNTREHVSV